VFKIEAIILEKAQPTFVGEHFEEIINENIGLEISFTLPEKNQQL